MREDGSMMSLEISIEEHSDSSGIISGDDDDYDARRKPRYNPKKS